MRITFRRATGEDVRQVCNLLQQLHENSNFSDLTEFDYESAVFSFLDWVDSFYYDVIVAEVNETKELVGIIVTAYQFPYFNRTCLMAYGLTIWIDLDYRKYNIGQKLYKKGIELAKEKGAEVLDLGVRNDNPALMKFHKRYGAVEHETIFRNRLN